MKIKHPIKIVISTYILYVILFSKFILAPNNMNALFFVDEAQKKCYSPPCVMGKGYDNIKSIQSYATENGYIVLPIKTIFEQNKTSNKELEPEEYCHKNGYVSDQLSLFGLLCRKFGITSKSRWNDDGTWNY